MMQQTAILLRGPAGVGKSTIGGLLQTALGEGWAHLDIDRLKHVMSKESSEQRSRIAHDVANYFLEQLFSQKYQVIAEEIFFEPYFHQVVELCRQHNIRVHQFFLTAPLDVLLKRDQDRAVKTKGYENISKLFSLIQPLGTETVIDTTKYTPTEIVQQIMQHINE